MKLTSFLQIDTKASNGVKIVANAPENSHALVVYSNN